MKYYKNWAFTLEPDRLTDIGSAGFRRTATLQAGVLKMVSPDEQTLLREKDIRCDGVSLSSRHPMADWCFHMARHDIEENFIGEEIYAGRDFRAGSTWVRDTSYSILQGLAAFYPAQTRAILLKLSANGRLKPEQFADVWEERPYNMTDNLLWVLAAEKLARVAGDDGVLRQGVPAALKTIALYLRERHNAADGLFIGGSSFFDGHNGYPFGMSGLELKSLSTNWIMLRALDILCGVSGLDAATRGDLQHLAAGLRAAIERELWLPERGCYAQFKFGRNYREERYEMTGNLLAVADPQTPLARARRLLAKAPRLTYGLPAIHPFYNERVQYHTGALWPFSMGVALWAQNERGLLASTAGGRPDATWLAARIMRTALLEGTFKELMEATTGRGIYSDAQGWSAAAMLAVVEHAVFGMRFGADRLIFRPHVPAFLGGQAIRLRDFAWRGRTVTLALDARGRVSVDGKRLPNNEWKMESTRATVSIFVPPELVFKTPPKKLDPIPAVRAQRGGIALSLSPAAVTVFPAEDQIGSYAFDVTVSNRSKKARSVRLTARASGPGLQAAPAGAVIMLAPGAEQVVTFRVGFKKPPVFLDRGRLVVAAGRGRPAVTAELRRLLTLDAEWRIKPMYKNHSHNFSGDFSDYESRPFLRVPMRGEERMGPHEGWLWLAHRVAIPAEWAGRELVFHAGGMADCDVTWFNGSEIGRTGDPKKPAAGLPRTYRIAAALVKPGAMNTLAVKTWNSGRDVGICRAPVFFAPGDEAEWAMAEAKRTTRQIIS